ncbi:DUF962 domain-containing protein [Caldimonas thermodepolymerans]|jgi:Predicted membrane protein|uniref:Membrane protein YGL010W n=1 Tax=Caldimonas thermodepolymerans TaxID=215580 RepID=A0A2S5T9J6_9BURK|nr:Mpo1-like protein [Caldimonas thermodepolymerans]PPE71661.1 hypothetical protein C1702_01315 [Caldimonas thermodepolymerans]QPC30689.1 DUF962 domain-containing protein [Caldimonas thermodepolymerans]RDI02701.1 putative membrane protein YGL010W [Caldimonas thermodepolymerans]TCP08769.1 putative membrane protein YGL010W [Caldimonas thermodepolymerans]UZG43424.1 DUF962 domain-containing protein [Caldimonas thermodepolymerans]
MRTALDLLTQYAEYHRDRRNIVTHFVGIPMIVLAVGILLARPAIPVGEVVLTPGWIVFAAAALWYLTRHFVLGLAVSVAVGLLVALGHEVGAGSTALWLGAGLGLFFVGWVIQFIGHYYEGRKPAFVDDLVGLLVGPMFVVAEAMFALGWNREMLHEIERRAGPTVLRDLANARP